MKDNWKKICLAVQIFREDGGQDLIEYALVVALIAFAATAGMSILAHDVNNAFSRVGSTLAVYAT